MLRFILVPLAAACTLALAADPAAASGPAGSDLRALPSSVCLIGNADTTSAVVPDCLAGAECLSVHFRAQETCDLPPGGGPPLGPVVVHCLLVFGPEDVPSTFSVRAAFDGGLPAWSGWGIVDPHLDERLCRTPWHEVTVAQAGVFDLAVPVAPSDTCCAQVYSPYDPAGSPLNLFLQIATAFPEGQRPGLVVSTETLYRTATWRDGLWRFPWDLGLPGDIRLWAEAEYCETGLPAREASWGAIKALYR